MMADQHRDIKMEDLPLGGGALMEHFLEGRALLRLWEVYSRECLYLLFYLFV